jgi:hypothetical protein
MTPHGITGLERVKVTVSSYGRENWYVILRVREEHRLRVTEHMVFRRILGHKLK